MVFKYFKRCYDFFILLFGVPKVKKNISLPLKKFLNPPLERDRMHMSEKDRVIVSIPNLVKV